MTKHGQTSMATTPLVSEPAAPGTPKATRFKFKLPNPFKKSTKESREDPSREPELSGGLMISRLTLTIVIANLIGLLILLLGSFGMTQYRDGLVASKLETVRTQAEMIAEIVAQVAADDLNCSGPNADPVTCQVSLHPEAVNLVFSRIYQSLKGRVRIYNAPQDFGEITEQEARQLLLEDVVLRKDEFDIETLPPVDSEEKITFNERLGNFKDGIVDAMPPSNFETRAKRRTLEAELTEAFSAPATSIGITSVRYNEEGELVASVSVPIRKVQAVYGVVTAEIGGIQDLVDNARGAILPFFALALVAAFLTSLLLTAEIAQPIRQLAIAADKVREGIAVAGRVRIPDYTSRRDEIGELSGSLREMTRAIYHRIEDIESFAADVSHELKNPLTSIRSAAETLDLAKTPEQKAKLMKVIQQDVSRMDRLITDISNASRLDAELAREIREPIILVKLLKDVVDLYAATGNKRHVRVILHIAQSLPELFVLGSPTSLGQVFRNLIDNAISFSPENGEVRLYITAERRTERDYLFHIRIDDEGPGIPPDNLESIFNRFYTERPTGADFGNNSGLGLAISRQITESHAGQIWAQNRSTVKGESNPASAVAGASFHVRLPAKRPRTI